MIKTIAKETGIVILLLIAVALVMGILFYEYIPTNEIVPEKIEEYALPKEVKKELQETIAEEQNIVRTYYIDSSDLSVYEATNDYDKGKANPFADYTVANTSVNNTLNNNNTTNNSVNNEQNSNKSETFFNNSGK